MRQRGGSIVLIGFMGTGKSSLGGVLQQLTGLPRYDTDEIISMKLGMPITDIFDEQGEAEFRRHELAAIAELPQRDAIIVTGGGVVLFEENVRSFRCRGTIVNLIADEETLWQRLADSNMRPLLRTDNPRRTFSELLKNRAPVYAAAADFEIDTSALTQEEVAQTVLNRIETLNAV